MASLKNGLQKLLATVGVVGVLGGIPYGVYHMHQHFKGWEPDMKVIMQDAKLQTLSEHEKDTITDLVEYNWREYVSKHSEVNKEWREEETILAALLTDALNVHELDYNHIFVNRPGVIPKNTKRLINSKGDYSLDDLRKFLILHDMLNPFVQEPLSQEDTGDFPEQIYNSINGMMSSGYSPDDFFVVAYQFATLVGKQKTFTDITGPISTQLRQIPQVLFYDNPVTFNQYLRDLAKVPSVSITKFSEKEMQIYLNPEKLANAAGVFASTVQKARQQFNLFDFFDLDRIKDLYAHIYEEGYVRKDDPEGLQIADIMKGIDMDIHEELYLEIMKNLFKPNQYLKDKYGLEKDDQLSPGHQLFSDEHEMKRLYLLSVSEFFAAKQLQMLNIIVQTADRHNEDPAQYAALASELFMSYLEFGTTNGMIEENIRKMKSTYEHRDIDYDLEKLIGSAASLPKKQLESYEQDQLQNLLMLEKMPGLEPFIKAIEKDEYLGILVEDIRRYDTIFRPFETARAAYNELRVQATRIGVNFRKDTDSAKVLIQYTLRLFDELLDIPTTYELEQLRTEALRRDVPMEETIAATEDILTHTYQRYHNAAILATVIYDINRDVLSLLPEERAAMSERDLKVIDTFSIDNVVDFMKHYGDQIDVTSSLAYTTENVKKIIMTAKEKGLTLEDARKTLDAIIDAGEREADINPDYLHPEKLANAVSYALMHMTSGQIDKFEHNIKSLASALKRQGNYLDKMEEQIDPSMYVYGAVTLSRGNMTPGQVKKRLNSYVDRWFKLLKDAQERPWLYMNEELTDVLNAEKLTQDSARPIPQNKYLNKDDPLMQVFRGLVGRYVGAEHLDRLFVDHDNIGAEGIRRLRSQTPRLGFKERSLLLRTVESLQIDHHEFDNLPIDQIHRNETVYDDALDRAEQYASHLFGAASVIGKNPILSASPRNLKLGLNLLLKMNQECEPAGEDSRRLYTVTLSDLVTKSSEHGVTIPQLWNLMKTIIDIPELPIRPEIQSLFVDQYGFEEYLGNKERFSPPELYSYRTIEKVSNALTQMYNNAIRNDFQYDDFVHVVHIASEISHYTCAFEDPNSFLVNAEKYLRVVKEDLGKKTTPLDETEIRRAVRLLKGEYNPHLHMHSPEKWVQDTVSTVKSNDMDWNYIRVN
jgi:polyhydroxyalkanoate synthesis regulator phasin